jgi:hypothetical protein
MPKADQVGHSTNVDELYLITDLQVGHKTAIVKVGYKVGHSEISVDSTSAVLSLC